MPDPRRDRYSRSPRAKRSPNNWLLQPAGVVKRLLVLLGLTVAAVMTPAGLASAGRAGGQCGLPLLQTLAARGARPFLLMPSIPNTTGDAAAWWQQAAQVADLVVEAYAAAPAVVAQSPTLGNRTIRLLFRRAVASLTTVGIP